MTKLDKRVLYPVILALAAFLGACSQEDASPPPKSVAVHTGKPATVVPARSPEATPPPPLVPTTRLAAAPGTATANPAPARPLAFTDARVQAKEFIAYFHSIQLTPEQERIKVEALTALKAPCCANYTMATCCCPCNMSKSVWGMAAWLITEKGYGVEQVRQAAVDWIGFINPGGFTGDSCFTGGCARPFDHNGCGGMKESDLL